MQQIVLDDKSILSHRGKLLQFLRDFALNHKDDFLVLNVEPEILDMDICKACCEIYCSLNIKFGGVSKGNNYLFDKKFFSRRCQMLNTMGLVFGFEMDFDKCEGDSVKLFRDRLDFALSLYPNHINFDVFYDKNIQLKPTATFSTQDIKNVKKDAFACQVFYSAGRAVSWFLSILKPLKMSPSKFFRDFSEWQKINNCDIDSSWNFLEATHEEIEKMQLSFLKFKYEEKAKSDIFIAVKDIVKLNGAFARCYGEEKESVLELNYNADELLGAGSADVETFSENSFMEKSKIKVYWDGDDCNWRYWKM